MGFRCRAVMRSPNTFRDSVAWDLELYGQGEGRGIGRVLGLEYGIRLYSQGTSIIHRGPTHPARLY